MPARWWRSARRGTALRLRCRARRGGQQFIDDVSALAGGVTVEAATHLVGDAADGGSFPPRRRRPETAPQYRRRLPARRSLTDVDPSLTPCAGEAWPIADQTANRGEFTPLVDGRNCVACRQRHEFFTPAIEKRIAADGERAGMRLEEGGEGALEVAFSAGLQDMELYPFRARRLLHLSYLPLDSRSWMVWVYLQGDHASV